MKHSCIVTSSRSLVLRGGAVPHDIRGNLYRPSKRGLSYAVNIIGYDGFWMIVILRKYVVELESIVRAISRVETTKRLDVEDLSTSIDRGTNVRRNSTPM